MGYFKDTAADADDAPASDTNTNTAPTRNVALKVKSYDPDASTTTGTDIETGEELTIKLRTLSKSFDKQGGVHLWSKPRGKSAVVAGDDGGVIVFESVVRDKEGDLSSRWGVVAAHDAGEADVSKMYARPATGFRNRNELDEKRAIEVARVDQSQRVSNEKELREAIAGIISRPYTTAVVRATDGDELRVATVWKGKDNTPDQAVDNFRKTNNFLGRHLNDDGVSSMQAVEVFPLERIYAGADTREMLRDTSKLDAQRFDRDWSLGEGKGWGFGESLVALRTHDQGGRFFTMMLPAVNRQALWALDSMPSPHITPAVAPVVSSDSTLAKAPEARLEGAADATPANPDRAPAAAQPGHEAGNDSAQQGAEQAPVMNDEVRSAVADKVANGVRQFRR